MTNEDSSNENLNMPLSEHSMKFAEMLRSHYALYHNHKETMAHSAVVIQIGLFAGIMSMKHWPPKWIQPLIIPEEWVAFTGYFLVWLLILLYVCWQLDKRRKAACKVKKQIASLRQLAINSEQNSKSKQKLEELFGKLMIKDAEDKGPVFSEVLIYIGTVLMLIAVLLRTLCAGE